jgi:hypothetical protein
VLASSCGSTPGPTCTISSVGVSAASGTVAPNTATTLTATVTQAAGSSSCTGGVTWSVSPAGGTLSPSELTASFSAPTAGTYTVTATSTDDPSKSGTAQLTVGSAGQSCTISAVGVSATATTVSPNLATSLTATVNQAAGSSGCSGGVTWSVSPTGGTLTPTGLTASFSAPTAGTYTVTATSTDDG